MTTRSYLRTLRRTLLGRIVRRQRAWIGLTLLLAGGGFALQILQGQAAVALVDRGIDEATEPLGPLVVAFFVVSAAMAVANAGSLFVIDKVRWTVDYEVRIALHRHLQSLGPRDLDGVPAGQVVTRAVEDLGRLQAAVFLVPIIVGAVPAVLGGMVYLGWLNFPLMLLVFSPLPVNLLIVRGLRSRLPALTWLQLDQSATVTRAVDEPIRGIRVVKLFNREHEEATRLAAAALRAYRVALTRVRLLARFDVLLKIVPSVAQALVLLAGARFLATGSLTKGEFLVFFVGSAQVTWLAKSFDVIVNFWTYARTGSARVGELTGDERGGMVPAAAAAEFGRAPVAAPPTLVPPPAEGLLARHVAGLDHPRTDGLWLHVRPGEVVGVTGPPTVSLSTLAAALGGLAGPGTVTVEGVDVALLDAPARGRVVQVLGAEPFLFARTVRDNLRLGSGDHGRADDGALQRALWAAAADEVVETLPDDLDTMLGDRAMDLSGGQRQRLALARALVNPPRVLVLDEALAGVHPALEAEVLGRLRDHAPRMAVVVVSARPSVLAHCDRTVTVAPSPPEPLPVDTFGYPMPEAVSFAAPGHPAPDAAEPTSPPVPVSVEPHGAPTSDAVAGDDRDRPRAVSLLRLFPGPVAATVAALAVLTIVIVLPNLLLGEATDLVERGDVSAADLRALVLLGLGLAGAGAAYVFSISSARLSEGVLFTLRRRLFARLSRLGIDYYDRELPGLVATRVVYDLGEVASFTQGVMGRLLVNSGTLVVAIALVGILSPELAGLVAAFTAAVVLLTVLQVPVAQRAYARQRDRLGEVVARLEEDLVGRDVISAAGAHRLAGEGFAATALRLRRADRWAALVRNGYFLLARLLAEVAGALVFWRAGNLVLAGALTTGAVLTLRLNLESALLPVLELGTLWQGWLRARVSFERLGVPWGHPIRPVERPGARACPPLRGDVTFDDVTFAYPGTDRRVLDGVSLRIRAGSLVAVVGRTGAGKSTIAKLAARVYDPDEGSVSIDGRDLREFTVSSLRRRVAVVPQDAFLFSGTVASNIAYARPDAGDDEIEAAARAVGADERLMALPGGYAEPVAEEARNLPIVERQLVAIARAWLAGPDLLVLDEATAALDEAAEQRVIEAVRHLGATTVAVTHRRVVAEEADLVVVVDEGRVTAAGPPADVLASAAADLFAPALTA